MEPEVMQKEFTRIANEAKAALDAQKKDLDAAIAAKASAEDIAALKTQISTDTEAMKEQLNQIGLDMGALKEQGKQPTDPRKQLTESLTAKLDEFKSLQTGATKTGKIDITMKAAGTILTTNIIPSVATAIPYSLVDFEPGVTRIARRQPFLRQLLNARPISSMYMAWAEQVNIDGGATAVAEGAAKPYYDWDTQERTQKVEKIAALVKTSRENLADVEAMRATIETELYDEVNREFDEELYSGSGTSPELKGLTTWATTMSVASTPFALGVDMANNWDVIMAAIAIMSNNHFNADTVVLNPLDYAFMMMVKEATTGAYIMHPLATAAGQNAAGITVVTNPLVTAGTFLVFDSTKVDFRIREEFTILVGYENDDFRKNLVSIIGEMRGVLVVKTNNANAVVKGVFATVKAAMETA